MRAGILAAAFAFIAVVAVAKSKPSAKIAALPAGGIAGHVYINRTLGVSYEYPSDWSVSTDPQRTINLDASHPDSPAVQCSRVLLWLDAPKKAEGKFSGIAALIAIDPGCLTNVQFPKSTLDRQGVNDVVDVLVKHFKHSPFFSPYGVRCQASAESMRVEFLLTGAMTINANESIKGQPAPAKDPLEVHTAFFVVESSGFWIARAYIADERSERALQQAKFSLTDTSAR